MLWCVRVWLDFDRLLLSAQSNHVPFRAWKRMSPEMLVSGVEVMGSVGHCLCQWWVAWELPAHRESPSALAFFSGNTLSTAMASGMQRPGETGGGRPVRQNGF